MLIKKLLIAFLLIFPLHNLFAAELIQVPAAIQISSKASDGKYTIPQILRICRDQGFKAVVITDRDLMRWEYGIWPLRNILRKTVEDNSISKYGVDRYIREFKEIQSKNQDLVVIPGIESAPFYYWQGDLWHNNLEIRDWHKHIISIGLKDHLELANLPVIGNRAGLSKPFRLRDLVLFWPLVLLVAGISLLGQRTCDYKNESGEQLAERSKSSGIAGILLIAAGAVFLMNNFPFRSYIFDQYDRRAGIKPYQNYIDYANKHSALSFWAHPEVSNIERSGAVSIRTEEHSRDLLLSRDYTGFAVFFEGYNIVGKIDGIWDSLLEDYCAGRRNKPVWAIGALSFDYTGNLEDYLKTLRTVLLVDNLNEQGCLTALRNGKMYAALGKNSAKFILSNFSVSDPEVLTEKTMGEELNTFKAPRIRIKGNYLNGQFKPFKIKLICNGKVINTFESASAFDIVYLDDQAPQDKAFYYRLEIQGEDVLAITNPIFVKRLKER